MTDWDSIINVPPLDIKNYQPDDWNTWFTNFRLYTNAIPSFQALPDKDKTAILFKKLGGQILPICETLDLNTRGISYSELLKELNDYFIPLKTRHVFVNAKQKNGESIDEFAQRLTMLSHPCCYGPDQDGILRDMFLINMDSKYSGIRDQIIKYYRDPSFEETVTNAKEILLVESRVSRSKSGQKRNTISSVLSALNRDLTNRTKEDEMSSNDSNNKHVNIPSSRSRPDQTPECSTSPVSTAINHALNVNSINTKGGSNYPQSNIPKLDFAFKCFSIAETADRYSRDQTSNTSCSKSSVSARLSKYGLQSVTAIRQTSSSKKHEKPKRDVPVGLQNSNLHNNNRSYQENSSRSNGIDANLHVNQMPINIGMANSAEDSRVDRYQFSSPVISPSHCEYSSRSTSRNSTEDSRVDRYQFSSCVISPSHGENSSRSTSHYSTEDCRVDRYQFSSCAISPSHGEDSSRSISRNSIAVSEPKSDSILLEPEPPISKTLFSDVVIVFISENDDTLYVCPVIQFKYLQIIELELRKLYAHNDLHTVKAISGDEKYAAPFLGDWFRAEIISANIKKNEVCILFCDYGNEASVSLSDLRILPLKFQEMEPLSFPIRLPRGTPEVQSGSVISIRLLSYEDSSWSVELRLPQRHTYTPLRIN